MVNNVLQARIFFFVAAAASLVSCGAPNNPGRKSPGPVAIGQGTETGRMGSTARFTILENRLYAVSGGGLAAFNITNPKEPEKVGFTSVGGDIETLFHDGQRLYVGAESAMYIYSVETPDQPSRLGSFAHARTRDPVVTAGTTAYVTLRNGEGWPEGGDDNQLFVLDITRPEQINKISSFPLAKPSGLGVVGNRLFVCDGTKGLVELNVEDPKAIKQVRAVADETCSDVIPLEKSLVVSGTAGISQYDLVSEDLSRLSRIETSSVVTPVPASKN